MQNLISVLIVEDEAIWAKQIEAYLTDSGFHIAAVANSVEKAIALLHTVNFDIALLDININGTNAGIDLGKLISNNYKKPYIFVTGSYDSHTAHEALAAGPSGYLIKPVNPISLFVTIQAAINNFNQHKIAVQKGDAETPAFFFVKHGNRYKKILWSDVVCLVAEKNYVHGLSRFEKDEFFLRSSLSKVLQDMIPANMQPLFLQINRAEVVNINFIDELKSDCIVTIRGNFSITETYNKEVKSRLNIF